MTAQRHAEASYEKRDWSFWSAAAVIGGVVLLILVGHLLSWWAARAFTIKPGRAGVNPPPENIYRLPSGPRLQINEARDMEVFRQEEAKWLNSYGWVDRAKGLVHIPIDQAMGLALRQGFPSRPATKEVPR